VHQGPQTLDKMILETMDRFADATFNFVRGCAESLGGGTRNAEVAGQPDGTRVKDETSESEGEERAAADGTRVKEEISESEDGEETAATGKNDGENGKNGVVKGEGEEQQE